MGFSGRSDGKESALETQVWFLDDPLQKQMATHSSILAWRIPWTEEPGYSPQGRRVGRDWVTSTHSLRYGSLEEGAMGTSQAETEKADDKPESGRPLSLGVNYSHFFPLVPELNLK